ncbi:hypothetical protein ACFW04_010035 [Cataglyphis niger]
MCDQICNNPYCWSCSPNCSSHLTPITNNNVGPQQSHIKRPMNPFMVWSSERRKEIAKENPRMHNSDISKQLGEEWKNLSQETKQIFIDKSHQLREEHKKLYPGYRYRPRKKVQTVLLKSAQESFYLPANYINGHPSPMPFNYISSTFNNNYPPPVLFSIHPHYSSYPEKQRVEHLSPCPSWHF